MGSRLAIDFGKVRVGIAVSEGDMNFSRPLVTLANDQCTLASILSLIQEFKPIEIYVGLPLNLKGDHTASTDAALEFAGELSGVTMTSIRMIDERLTTRSAQSQFFASGKSTKESKSSIDAAAASLILEGAIALETKTGRIPGLAISEFDV